MAPTFLHEQIYQSTRITCVVFTPMKFGPAVAVWRGAVKGSVVSGPFLALIVVRGVLIFYIWLLKAARCFD